MSRARLAARRAIQCLPLLGALVLLRELPVIAQTPLAGVVVLPWRLDALTLVFLLSLAAAVAVVPLHPRQVLPSLALAAVLAPALLLEHLLALPGALLLAALVLRSRRWLLAGLLLSGALAWPYATTASGWNDALVASGFGAPVAAALLASVAVVLAPWPLRTDIDNLELALLPIWLLPLLRAIGLLPWRTELALLALVTGCVAALWSTVAALRSPHQLRALVASGWLAAALAASGLLTTVGVAAALYGVLAYPLGLGLLLRAPRLASPLPLSAGFVSVWLAVGAAGASGAWLAAAALLLAALGSGAALVLPEFQPRNPAAPGSGVETPGMGEGYCTILLAAWWALGICAPPLIEQLILPAVDLLQGGLTPFGLLAVWPWIGVAALDAGQRRVTTLPSIAILLLGLVGAAGVWLVARVRTPSSERSSANPTFARVPLRRVWWLGGRHGE